MIGGATYQDPDQYRDRCSQGEQGERTARAFRDHDRHRQDQDEDGPSHTGYYCRDAGFAISSIGREEIGARKLRAARLAAVPARPAGKPMSITPAMVRKPNANKGAKAGLELTARSPQGFARVQRRTPFVRGQQP